MHRQFVGRRTAPELKARSDLSRLAFDCEFKFDAGEDGSIGLVSGYASVFGLLDRGGDIVMKGAFRKSLAEIKRRKAHLPMLWQHDSWQPIGVWTKLEEDERGLKVEGQLILDIQQAADARALIKAGALKGMSIGYETIDREIDRATGARQLKEVRLWEISLVTFPMLPEAQLDGVKTDFDPNLLERLLRDEGGLSIREAKAAVSVFRKHALRDAGSPGPAPRDEAAEMLMTLRKAAETLR